MISPNNENSATLANLSLANLSSIISDNTK